jgi:hypothetical protein
MSARGPRKNPPHIHSGGQCHAPSRSAPKLVNCDLVGATGDGDAAPNLPKCPVSYTISNIIALPSSSNVHLQILPSLACCLAREFIQLPSYLRKVDQVAGRVWNFSPMQKWSSSSLWQYITSPCIGDSSCSGVTCACSPGRHGRLENTRTPWPLTLSV